MIRLGLVDDHPVFRVGLSRLLDRERDLTVVWELESVTDLFTMLARSPVDTVLMDLMLGQDQDALAATRAVRETYRSVRVIVISGFLDWEAAAGARAAGASGYLPKNLGAADMLATIRGLASPDFGTFRFDDRLGAPSARNREPLPHRHGLTKREQEVLAELRFGSTNKEIAARLHISITTTTKHVQRILEKLQVRSRAEAAAMVHDEVAGRPTWRSGEPDLRVAGESTGLLC